MKPTVVIYHRADWDGIFCREIARKHLGEVAEYIGWDYNDPTPVIAPEVELIYILDLSVPELMADPRVVWIDHHITAIKQYSPDIPGVRLEGVAACRLAWQWFHDSLGAKHWGKKMYVDRIVSEPVAVRLAGEYDIWDKRDPDAETFQHALNIAPELDRVWRDLLTVGLIGRTVVDFLMPDGRKLEALTHRRNAELIKERGFDITFEGYRFLALNTARCNSLTFQAGLKPEHDGCFAYAWTGKVWRVSLYGVPGKPALDFSGIAKRYGGGGHPQACGFTAPFLPFFTAPNVVGTI